MTVLLFLVQKRRRMCWEEQAHSHIVGTDAKDLLLVQLVMPALLVIVGDLQEMAHQYQMVLAEDGLDMAIVLGIVQQILAFVILKASVNLFSFAVAYLKALLH